MAGKKSEKTKKGKAAAASQVAERKYSLSRVNQFLGEVKSEFKKIVWPDRKVTMGSTGVVIVLVLLVSFYLGAVDLIIGKMVSFILN